MQAPEKLKKRLLQELQHMDQMQESWKTHWRDLRDYLLPRHGRHLDGVDAEAYNRGDKKHRKIYDGGHLRAAHNFGGGMHSGLTSPARPWFRFAFGQAELDDDHEVKTWLYECEEIVRGILNGSNIYNVLPNLYEEFGVFGTGAMTLEEDFDDTIHARAYTIGEYKLATDNKGRVTTFGRTVSYTASQMRDEFGEEKLEQSVLEALRKGNHSQRFLVYQIIQKRDKHNDLPQVRQRPWASLWFSKSQLKRSSTLLKVSGFETQPFMTPRWKTVGDNVYGESPGMDVLPDVKSLQAMAKDGLAGINKAINPPILAPGEMRGSQINTFPGGVTYSDLLAAQGGLKPLYEVRPEIGALYDTMQQYKVAVHEGLFADLFKMLQFAANSNMTATEVAERQQEKLLLLGPVLERVYSELLDPLLLRVFDIAARNELLPEAPEVLEGQTFKIVYISILAQAQRLAGISNIEQLAGFAGNLSAVDPTVLDNVDFDEMLHDYADRLGVNPKVIRPQEEVDERRQARAQQEQEMAQLEMANQGAQAAKTLSEVDTGENSALAALTQGLG
jgi:hypothetical protein